MLRAGKLAQSPRNGQPLPCPRVPCKFFTEEALDIAHTVPYEELSGWSRRSVCSQLQIASPAPPITPQEAVMTSLIPRDTFFQDLFDFRRDFDQIFNRFLSWPSAQEESTMTVGFSPAVESFIDKEGKKFHCQVMLPGVDPKDVNLQVQGNTLTITGERSATRETKEADYLRREITYGSFQRSHLLSQSVDTDKLKVEYPKGILAITPPLAA